MKPTGRLIPARIVFSLFVSLFFITPICTIFVPFCTVSWMLGVTVVATTIFFLSGFWIRDRTDRPGSMAVADQARPAKARTVSRHTRDNLVTTVDRAVNLSADPALAKTNG